jgi:phosphatidylglycerophosphate synthase
MNDAGGTTNAAAAAPAAPATPSAAQATPSAAQARRPIAARNTAWAARVARWLVRRGVTPNQISLASIACAAVAAAALVAARFVASPVAKVPLYLVAIAGVQARLLCNLFDGMVAIEGGRAGKAGEVFNDFPDRIADPLILTAAGYAAGGAWGVGLGWLASVLAVMTAYVRVLGRSLGTGIDFSGPMAKQHRMAVMTAAFAAAAVASFWAVDRAVLVAALAVVCAGCVVTIARRTARVVRALEWRP